MFTCELDNTLTKFITVNFYFLFLTSDFFKNNDVQLSQNLSETTITIKLFPIHIDKKIYLNISYKQYVITF